VCRRPVKDLRLNPIPIHAHNPSPYTGDGNWTWLLRGRVTTLIDAGTGEQAHLDDLERALEGSPLAQVLVTHAHGDHASGAPALAARFPGVRCRKMPWADRDGRWPVAWEPIAAGEQIAAGDETLSAIHTPGHAPDHIAFWHEPSRTLFSGDLAVKGTTVFIPSNSRGDLSDYLASLERVIALQPTLLLPAHGPVIDDPRPVLRGYIEHRQERERQIVHALNDGPLTPDELVARIYRGLKDTLVPLARESVVAHLVKLARDGRAGRRGEAWHIIGP
jgi:glyoxylase-like metal-dependent hydrolase (beta-lactamase superfamily II)